jgi:hypothetical protein
VCCCCITPLYKKGIAGSNPDFKTELPGCSPLQGVPILPDLFLVFIRDICRTRLNTFTFSYIYDICIGVSARSTKKLEQILERTATALLQEAKRKCNQV